MAEILQGDVIEVLRGYADESFTCVLADPPYGLEFMGVAWDTFKDRSKGTARTNNTWGDFGSREHARTPDERGRIQRNKGIALYEFSLAWAIEVLRVMKPGGVLMAFGGSRTHHRLMVAIEDAGFEIFDTMMWLYGSGFPKSHDISKAIDKAAGAEREVIGSRVLTGTAAISANGGKGHAGKAVGVDSRGARREVPITAPATPDAATWQGYGTALKPAWEPVVLARKPRRTTYAATALEHGSGGLWIDGGRVGTEAADAKAMERVNTPGSGQFKPHGQSQGNPCYGEYAANKTPFDTTRGRWPANLLLSHSPGCVRRGERRVKTGKQDPNRFQSTTGGWKSQPYGNQVAASYADADGLETIENWDCVPDCAVRLLGEQSGERPSAGHYRDPKGDSINRGGTGGSFASEKQNKSARKRTAPYSGQTGTAARFFKNFDPPLRFRYSAKASRAERDSGLPDGERSGHPCVKPLAVTRYLATLLRPPEAYLDEATILVPFAGSGSEMIGALLAGWRNAVGIELQQEYVAIAEARLEWWGKAMALTHETDPQAILAAMKGRDIDDPVQSPMFNGPLT